MTITRQNVAMGLGVALVAFAALTFTSGQFVPGGGGAGGGGIPPTGTGTLTVSHVALVGATTNLSTEGTVDWAWTGANAFPTHSKLASRYYLQANWQILIGPGTGNSSTTQASGVAGFNMTSTAADDVNGAALSSNVGTMIILTNNALDVGAGYRVRIPLSYAQPRVIRVYAATFSCKSTLTASFAVAGTSASDFIDPGTSLAGEAEFTINATAGTADEELTLLWQCTVNHAASVPNVKMYAITEALL